MKVKELIEQLSKCDPEAEVIAEGKCIYFIEELPGYYDGSYQVLIQDKSSPYFNIKGVEFTRANKKVRLNMMDFEDVIQAFTEEDYINNLIFKFDPSLREDTILSLEKRISEIKTEALDWIKNNKENK